MDLRWSSCSSSGVGAGVDRHRRQGSPRVNGIHRGGERDVDAAHGAARLAAVALPAVTSASEVVSAA
jgi:citrate lyase beta subunit